MAAPQPASDFLVSIHDLKRQPGEMMEIRRNFANPERIGIDVIAIESQADFQITGRVESVSTGVLTTCDISSSAVGECVRCLDPISLPIDVQIQELYFYEIPSDWDDDDDPPPLITEERIDLLPPIRDAVILELPLAPHCSDDCLGLCPECGEKIGENPQGHNHQKIDPRWAKLRELPGLEEQQ